MKRFSVMLALLAALLVARAEGPDDQYLRIYDLIQEADSLNNNVEAGQALEKYLEAQSSLQRLQKVYPDWNPKVVEFRLNYLAAKINAIAPQNPAPVAAPEAAPKPAPAAPLNATFALPPKTAPKTAPPPPPPPSEVETQLNSLRGEVRQLQADKILLEAKLKESLAAQPAAVDPRELAKAEEKIRALQKESDLLKVTLAREKSKPPPPPDTKALEQAQQALAAQTGKANALAAEKKSLQAKLDALAPATWNAAALETLKKALEDANRQLAQQKAVSARLASEKGALQAQLKTSNPDSDAVVALRAENQLLKKQLADLRAAAAAPGKPLQPGQNLAQAEAQIATLKSDKEILRLEKIALENRVKQLFATAAPPASPPAAARSPAQAKTEDAARIKQLEQERDALLKKLDLATKDLSTQDQKPGPAPAAEPQNQVSTLRARLEVFEARQVPYTPEELALFKRPLPKFADAGAQTGKKAINEMPPGAASLVAEAQRCFAAGQLDKAEEKYLQVLAQDDKNATVLANLATIQLELHHLDDAEKHILQAVALAPDDAYTLSILGYCRFLQDKYDDALDALSRAAALDPQNAQVLNYLGITLSQKGFRVPAENALRKAVQLEPNYGSAHHNLAVVYLTQRPPAIEMARLHYQKALASGHPHNPNLEKMLETPKPGDSGQ